VALFAVSLELLGLDVVMEYVGTEPSGVKSNVNILNSDNLPYNPFMWNGVLALCSLLEERTGDAVEIIADYWAKLCGTSCSDCPMQHDEVFEEEDKMKNGYRVNVLVYTSFDLEKFPANTPANIVMSIFFRLRAIKTGTTDLGSIAAVLANGGVHPTTNVSVFQPDTVRQTLSMMYSAGCEAQSGELSFKVGVPAKSSSEGVMLIVLPNIMGLAVVSPKVQENGVSLGGWKFCEDFGAEFNCHVLAGSATSSAKNDPSLYHFHMETELGQQLLEAAERGDIMNLTKLHQLGFSFDWTDYDYRSAAHVAACNGHVKVLKYLFRKGADMQAKDRWGIIAMDDATRKGHHKAAALLKNMVRDDDGISGGMSDVGSQVSTMTAGGHRKLSSTKIERTQCPVAAKMRMGSWDAIQEGDCEGEEDEEDEVEEQEDLASIGQISV
jgi:glutaminase